MNLVEGRKTCRNTIFDTRKNINTLQELKQVQTNSISCKENHNKKYNY